MLMVAWGKASKGSPMWAARPELISQAMVARGSRLASVITWAAPMGMRSKAAAR